MGTADEETISRMDKRRSADRVWPETDKTCDAWDTWLALLDEGQVNHISIVISDYEQITLDRLRWRADLFIDDWNEWELRTQLVSQLVSLADFNDWDCFVGTFSKRNLMATVKGIQQEEEIELSGTVDWMIATGHGTPRTPYFFIHE